jgi:hypothetical protein
MSCDTHRGSDGRANGWHVPLDALAAYRQGDVHGTAADSIEAHLLSCAGCRTALARSLTTAGHEPGRDGTGHTDAIWSRIADAIDRPSRWSRRSTWLRLAVGTPRFAAASGVLAIAFLVVPLAVALVDRRAAVSWFFALAPTAPLAGTVTAYRAAGDPAGDLADATPMHSLRIVMIRVAVVLGVVVPAGVLASVLLPGSATLFLGWVLPTLACCALVLALGAHADPTWLAAVFGGAWTITVALGLHQHRLAPVGEALDALVVNRGAAQLAALLITTGAMAHVAMRRDAVSARGRRLA